MTNFILSILNMLSNWIMRFPDLSVDNSHIATMISSMDIVIEFLATVNYIVPIPTILLVLTLIYSIQFIKFSIFLINWIVRRIFDIIP